LAERFIAGFSLIVFTTLAIFNPIVVRVAHKETAKHGYTFVGSTTVFAMEILKTLFCCVVIPIRHRSLKK
jgi:hypothetical protein